LNTSTTKVAQESVTKIIFLTITNLVMPKAGAKHELLFNKLAFASVAQNVLSKIEIFKYNRPYQK
jgi:hypothetical protein